MWLKFIFVINFIHNVSWFQWWEVPILNVAVTNRLWDHTWSIPTRNISKSLQCIWFFTDLPKNKRNYNMYNVGAYYTICLVFVFCFCLTYLRTISQNVLIFIAPDKTRQWSELNYEQENIFWPFCPNEWPHSLELAKRKK